MPSVPRSNSSSGGSWTDITQFVMLRNDVQIGGMGRTDWTSTLQAATLKLTLKNDGRFTPKLAAGAYFPNITRNTQIRVSVNAASVTAVAYSGYRFWGEVAEWPPAWNVAGRDVHVDITANGIWRRMSQLQTSLGSAYTRYNSLTLTGTSAPRCYWPCEDGAGSGSLVAYDSVAGTANATQSWTTGTGLSLAACTDFKGSDGIPQLNAALITCTVPAGGTATNNVTRFLLSVPAAGDSASGTVNWDLAEINSAGTVAKFEVLLMTTGHLRMYLRNSGGTVLATADTTTNVQGHPYLVSCELTPSGGNVAFALRLIAPGAAGITESMTGTITTASVGQVSSVRFSRGNTLMDTAVGHLSVTYGAVPSMVSAAAALGGYVGEKAMDRFTRICGEMGIAAETIGTASTTAAMGPQVDDTLTNVLQSVEDADMGLLFESRTQFGLGYRALTSMANQAAAATISYTAGILDPSLAPVYDDSLTRNNVTVTNQSSGYTQQSILMVGAMSILNPPSGIGNGYAYERTVNAAADGQIAGHRDVAPQRRRGRRGAVPDGYGQAGQGRRRRPVRRPARAAARRLPADHHPARVPHRVDDQAAGVRVLRAVRREQVGLQLQHRPRDPVRNRVLRGDGADRAAARVRGRHLDRARRGGLGGIIQNGFITPSMLSEGISVKTIGGALTTISVSAPATPNTGDIWIASATGLLSQWNGTTWVPFQFDGSATIQAGSIIAANIATGTLTSSLIAAGQVYAGFVDATTITGAQFVATGSAGEILIYSGSPAAGNLIGAWSGGAGTDAYGNAFSDDISAFNITALQPGSNPTALETWHTLGPIGNGWTTNHGRYRRTAENEIQLDVSLTAGGSPTYGNITWPNTMPAAYRPIVVRRLAGVPSSGSASHSTDQHDRCRVIEHPVAGGDIRLLRPRAARLREDIMAVNVPNPGVYLTQLGAELTALRDAFDKLTDSNAYIASMGGSTFLTAAFPNGLGLSSGDASALIATLGNHAALATQYNGGAQAPALNYRANGEPFWGGPVSSWPCSSRGERDA